MSETSDYTPAPCWKGHDFKSARKDFDVHVGRSYDDAVETGKSCKDLIPSALSSDSKAPVVIFSDVTGSMGEWPAVFFSKLPYLEHEGKEYLGEDLEVCFGAVGDAYVDKYPLQLMPFAKGKDLEEALKKLVIEGGGGSGLQESYELAAIYCARKISIPKAINPICIFIGDEMPYEFVDSGQAKELSYIDLQKHLSTADIFKEICRKWSVYLIRKPYGSTSENAMSETDRQIHKAWSKLLGEEHISILPEAGRVVDVVFGIFAKETGRIDYFREEIEGRQKKEQINVVYKSLETIHGLPGRSIRKLSSGHSMRHKDSGGPDSKSLL